MRRIPEEQAYARVGPLLSGLPSSEQSNGCWSRVPVSEQPEPHQQRSVNSSLGEVSPVM